ncbi:MAG: hypothetical protein ACK5QC_01200 [Bacteroidota bacterium]
MKSIKSKIIITYISFSLLNVSCKKNYNCICSTASSEGATIINDKKKNAKEKCSDMENELKATQASFTCVLQ